jgi:hypothetical protein
MESRFGSRRKPNSKRPLLFVALGSAVLGGAAASYGMWHFGAFDEKPVVQETKAAPTSEVMPLKAKVAKAKPGEGTVDEAVEQTTEKVERVAQQAGGIDQRLAAAEQRIARLDLQAQAASGNAARAEGLLIAFATRRSIERGAELGPLEGQLRLRFGGKWNDEVDTVAAFSRDPIKLDELSARLEGLAGTITTRNETPSWDSFKREVADLFVVRHRDTPSPQPEKRLERARMFLETGRISSAVAEVEKMPGASEAAQWIADAKRLSVAMDALEQLEIAAVLDSGSVRDGEGNLIDQPSPAGDQTDQQSGFLRPQ